MITGATNFFTEKWKKVYKEEPDIEELNNKIQNSSIRICPHMVFFDERKREPVKILATYWIPSMDVVIKIDLESRSAVTFYGLGDLK